MADPKQPRRGAQDYTDLDLTNPGVTFRAPQPQRIATPLSDQLKPSATAPMVRSGSQPNPAVAPASRSSQPLPGVAPAQGRVQPPLAAPEPTPAPGTRMPPAVGTRPSGTPTVTAPMGVQVRPAEVAQRAAAALSQNASSTMGTQMAHAGTSSTMVDDPRATLHGGPGLAQLAAGGDVIRVHRLPPPEKIDPRLVLTRAPDSNAAASYRVLRHRLVERAAARVILVTSPVRKEGKTTLAMNLALALGEAGRGRVLLLEANLRNPSIAGAFGFRPPVCFGEQLEFHRTHPLQPWVVVENVSPFLHVAAVSPDAQPRSLVDGPAVAIALEQLRGAAYEHIVIDSPPVLGSADVNLLEEYVDGVLLAVAARRSRARTLRRAIQQIGASKILGTVLIEK